ncbi:Hypothetical predicted protein [Marmota monax]|uniref:Uncharacterized protein n=1 Tax=Marmota monax TaxID=9995 RepID=A0A5E4AKE4_MARMO|nr:hypothetical protein GHT09_006473 [Marmota monax]VTJ57913.1 Hypothetical predicted protein [Marmota monax]
MDARKPAQQSLESRGLQLRAGPRGALGLACARRPACAVPGVQSRSMPAARTQSRVCSARQDLVGLHVTHVHELEDTWGPECVHTCVYIVRLLTSLGVLERAFAGTWGVHGHVHLGRGAGLQVQAPPPHPVNRKNCPIVACLDSFAPNECMCKIQRRSCHPV